MRKTVYNVVVTEDFRPGDHVQVVLDPEADSVTIRRPGLCCAWCPTYAHPDPANHPGGQAEHVVAR